jgi:hypothetical protein
MLRSGTDAAKAQPLDQLGHALFLIGHAKALFHQGAQITKPPSHDPMLGQVRTGLNQGCKLLQLGVVQTAGWAWTEPVIETLWALGIETVDPIAERLSIHHASLRGFRTLGPFQN